MRRCATPGRAIDGVRLLRTGYAADDPRRRIGGNANPSQVARECLAPISECRLADVQASALLADRLDDHVDMRMRLVGVQKARTSRLGGVSRLDFDRELTAHGCSRRNPIYA
jgi:hypothetical protein